LYRESEKMTLYGIFGGMVLGGIFTFIFSGYFWKWYIKRNFIAIPKLNSYTKKSFFEESKEIDADV
jgi:hypothetical protein